MKKLMMLLLAMSATANAMSFDCISKDTGKRYVVDGKSKKVSVYSGSELLSTHKFKMVETDFIETFPGITSHQFKNSAETVIVIENRDESEVFTGSFGNDNGLICSPKAERK